MGMGLYITEMISLDENSISPSIRRTKSNEKENGHELESNKGCHVDEIFEMAGRAWRRLLRAATAVLTSFVTATSQS